MEGDDCVGRPPRFAVTACGDDDILPPIRTAVRHGRRFSSARQFGPPQLAAGLDVEGAKLRIDARGNEHQTAAVEIGPPS
jgi:hypothetical protein